MKQKREVVTRVKAMGGMEFRLGSRQWQLGVKILQGKRDKRKKKEKKEKKKVVMGWRPKLGAEGGSLYPQKDVMNNCYQICLEATDFGN